MNRPWITRPAISKQVEEAQEVNHPSGAESAAGKGGEGRALVFVYGTLKRGFGNEWLMKEMMEEGRARYVGKGRSKERYPLVIGPYQVPFLLKMQGFGEHVYGELYCVDAEALQRLDHLEGTAHGHYIRESIDVVVVQQGIHTGAWAYFAGSSYAGDMWMKTGPQKCVSAYSKQHSLSYVKRKDRPPDLSFLQHIHIFLDGTLPPSSRS